MSSSPQFQRRETEEREDDRENQEARDDLRLSPADELEMVVERRHLEDALAAAKSVRRDLDDHGRGLDHEHTADDRQQQLLFHEDRDRAERAAERERPDVAHED